MFSNSETMKKYVPSNIFYVYVLQWNLNDTMKTYLNNKTSSSGAELYALYQQDSLHS